MTSTYSGSSRKVCSRSETFWSTKSIIRKFPYLLKTKIYLGVNCIIGDVGKTDHIEIRSRLNHSPYDDEPRPCLHRSLIAAKLMNFLYKLGKNMERVVEKSIYVGIFFARINFFINLE